MKIINIDGRKICACFVFEHGNCEISVSTIFNKNKPEIAIFDKRSDALLKNYLNSIEDALSWVSTFGPRD
jgi:hypothetical protein